MKKHLNLHWTAKTSQTFVLDLDQHFTPFDKYDDIYCLNVQQFDFVGGEPNIKISPPTDHGKGDLYITQRFNSINDLFAVILAADAAKRLDCFSSISLFMPYFPGARQDRVCNPGEALTVKVFADMINNCGFEKVYIYSPHSDVTPALINNVVLLDRDTAYVGEILSRECPSREDSIINIVCPDAGAGKRVGEIAKRIALAHPQNTVNFIRCEKVRDVKSGAILEFAVHSDDLGGYPTLIIDDINCYGGTFLGLGAVLKEKNAGKMMLFTSHSDTAQGINNVLKCFDAVYTTNSKQNFENYVESDRFTCFKLEF